MCWHTTTADVIAVNKAYTIPTSKELICQAGDRKLITVLQGDVRKDIPIQGWMCAFVSDESI